MLELLVVVVFVWLLVKATGLALKLTWGMAKVVASILMVLALPTLVLCLIFDSSIALIAPLAVLGIAVGILKVCV